MSLIEKLKKNSTIKGSAVLTKSKVWGKASMMTTPIPEINLALSGRIDGGLLSGHHAIAGPSRHFKSMFGLYLAGIYQKLHPDAVILFYDNEFGTTEKYMIAGSIDMSRVFHTPFTTIEELKHDLAVQLEEIKRDDHVFILIDSMGAAASRKETEDAKSGNTAADMTRAKELKSFYRIITPHLEAKDIKLVTIQHTYKTMEMYAKDVMSGGTGGMLSANSVWIVGREKKTEKEDAKKKLTGFKFKIKIEKSRFMQEGAIIPVTVDFKYGMVPYSGLIDIAKLTGHLKKTKPGRWAFPTDPTAELTEDEVIYKSEENWKYLLTKTDFPEKVRLLYEFGGSETLAGDTLFVVDPGDPLNDEENE